MELTEAKLQELMTAGCMQAIASAKIGDALAHALSEALKPGVFRPLVAEHGDEKFVRATKGLTFFKGIFDAARGKAVADEVLGTGANARGLYTVPTSVMEDVLSLEPKFSLIRQYGRVYPQTELQVNYPVLTSGATINYPSTDGAAATTSLPVFDMRPMNQKIGNGIIVITQALLRGSAIRAYDFLVTELARASGQDLDIIAFTDSTTPFNGILNVAGKTRAIAGGASIEYLDWPDLTAMQNSLATTASAGATFIFSPTVFGKVCEIKDGSGRPVVLGAGLGIPPTILSAGYLLSDHMPSRTAAASPLTACGIYGNLQNYLVGEADALELAVSDQASINTGSGVVSMFQSNCVAFKITVQRALNVGLVNAFCKLETSV